MTTGGRSRATRPTGRRAVLAGAGASLALVGTASMPRRALADPETTAREIWRLMGAIEPRDGRVVLDMPAIAENGFVVPLTVSVDSPMTAADHVKAIHVFAELNPWSTLASFHFGPLSGRAQVATRVRLARTQDVMAFAVMNDGSVWRTVRRVEVVIGGCGA
ncbi:MAG TPA: thiosulfate oxidation carrier protein SoxY [Alphaproteobacteria bacterium]